MMQALEMTVQVFTNESALGEITVAVKRTLRLLVRSSVDLPRRSANDRNVGTRSPNLIGKKVPFQPLLIKSIFSLLTNAEKNSFFKTTV